MGWDICSRAGKEGRQNNNVSGVSRKTLCHVREAVSGHGKDRPGVAGSMGEGGTPSAREGVLGVR